MDPTLDAYYHLACAVLHRAVLDARQPSAGPACNFRARFWLMSEDCEWLVGAVGLDIETIRERVLGQWMRREAE
jgi:hypothetical protein